MYKWSLDGRVQTILVVIVHVTPIVVMQAASMAVTVRHILCIQTALSLLRAAPSFILRHHFFVELHDNRVMITNWASSAQFCF